LPLLDAVQGEPDEESDIKMKINGGAEWNSVEMRGIQKKRLETFGVVVRRDLSISGTSFM